MTGSRAVIIPVSAAVVLAAGSARRFGGRKVLAELAGRALLTHVLDAVASADVHEAVVVLPPRSGDADVDVHAAVVALLAERAGALPLTVVENPDAALGMSTSLRVGLEVVARRSDVRVGVVVVLLADQPTVDPDVVRAVVQACAEADRPARAVYRDGAGPPVALPLRLVASLAPRLTGDRGLRDLLDDLEVVAIEVDAPMPLDVDHPEDLEALQQR